MFEFDSFDIFCLISILIICGPGVVILLVNRRKYKDDNAYWWKARNKWK